MAATPTLPNNSNVAPITTDSIVLPFETGPIAQIMEPIPTHSVDFDIRSLVTQEVLSSDVIVLGVIAIKKSDIEDAINKMLGGLAFLYELGETKGFPGHFDLKIFSQIGPLVPLMLAKKFQSVSHKISIFFEGKLVPAL
jgi:hypothetical protein